MKFIEFLDLTRSDLFRYAGSARLKDFIKHYMLSPGYRYSFWMRKCAYTSSNRILKYIAFPICWLTYYHLQIKFGIQISYQTSIGRGLDLGHYTGIVVNQFAVIGENCNISNNVTIGVSRRGERKGVPHIGNNVYIGPGARIFGEILVGDNAAIGANCVVTKDVPDNGVVVGVPGKIISLDGSKGYINNIDYFFTKNYE